jgi:hypothetical protein
MNNQEIDNLRQRIETLESIIRAYGLMQESQPLKMAAIALNQSEWTLRKMVNEARLNPRKSKAKVGIHYSFNGNRILINVNNWKRDIKSLAPENR